MAGAVDLTATKSVAACPTAQTGLGPEQKISATGRSVFSSGEERTSRPDQFQEASALFTSELPPTTRLGKPPSGRGRLSSGARAAPRCRDQR